MFNYYMNTINMHEYQDYQAYLPMSDLLISDAEALRIHRGDGNSTDSDGGKSEFDDEYSKYKPPPLQIDRSKIVTIKCRAKEGQNSEQNTTLLNEEKIETVPDQVNHYDAQNMYNGGTTNEIYDSPSENGPCSTSYKQVAINVYNGYKPNGPVVNPQISDEIEGKHDFSSSDKEAIQNGQSDSSSLNHETALVPANQTDNIVERPQDIPQIPSEIPKSSKTETFKSSSKRSVVLDVTDLLDDTPNKSNDIKTVENSLFEADTSCWTKFLNFMCCHKA